MILYGFAKDCQYDNEGTLKVQVRIPQIHGPFRQESSKGAYTRDKDLPWLTCLLTVNIPVDGDVLMLQSVNESQSSEYVCLGLTGGNYYNGTRI